MQVTIFDDKCCYNGRTSNERPPGSTEEAVVGLSEALAELGHDIEVVNQCTEVTEYNGVRLPREAPRPPSQELVIALRKPGLPMEA